MKKTFLFIFPLYSALLAIDVKVTVVDEVGDAVVGAEVQIILVNGGKETMNSGKSNHKGQFQADGRPTNLMMIFSSKPKHYPARINEMKARQDLDFQVVLPRVQNPVPLYAWDSFRDVPVEIPVQEQWLGFDFEKADWVAPNGKGRTPDILFRFKNEFKGWQDRFESAQHLEEIITISKKVYAARKEEWTMDKFKVSAGKWDGVLEISFPGKGDGLYVEKKILTYSELSMPHSAPIDGYVPSWVYKSNNYSPSACRKDVGFFLRTRVRLDKDGRVISANYAKVIGDFCLDAARSSFSFSYYFNPYPDDRNLEFDPKNNLFPKDKPGTNVYNR